MKDRRNNQRRSGQDRRQNVRRKEDEQEEKQSNECQEQDGEEERSIKEEIDEMEKNRQKAKKMFENMSKPKIPQEKNRNNFSDKLGDWNINEIPESTIKILINKFFEKSFSKKSDLNKTKSSNQNKNGDEEWDIEALITHRISKNYQAMLTDKKGHTKKERW